jgi:hypothetical protein
VPPFNAPRLGAVLAPRSKAALNAALRRATGYVLVRHERRGAPPPPPAPKRRPRRSRAPVDREAREIIVSVKDRTMTSREKLFALIVGT